MKKVIILIVFILSCFTSTAFASAQFDKVLSDIISEYGISENGIIYADELNFENRQSLFVVIANNGSAECRVYDDADGIQLTDTVSLPLTARLSIAEKNDTSYILSGTDTFFTLQNDSFVRVEPIRSERVKPIAEIKNGKLSVFINRDEIFHCLNQLKQKTITEYPFQNRINAVFEEDLKDIKTMLSACADLMSFDIKNYDYDTIFKYVLYTHQNFKVLTDIDPMTGSSSSLGYNNVSIAGSSFIDYIMENILRISPEKPPVNNLLNRGFCYSGGYYYYTGGFDVFFSTEIKDIIGIYDLGGNAVYIVFSDIYTEGDTKTPEYSFAIMQKSDSHYSLLRLGMGKNLPSAEEVMQYSPALGDTKSEDGGDTKTPFKNSKIMLPVLLLIISVGIVGIVGFIFAIAALLRDKHR